MYFRKRIIQYHILIELLNLLVQDKYIVNLIYKLTI